MKKVLYIFFIIVCIVLVITGQFCITGIVEGDTNDYTVSRSYDKNYDLLIYEVYPNTYSKNEPEEFISIINPSNHDINLKNYSVTDLEGIITFYDFLLRPGDKCYWAYSSDKFKETMGFYPEFSYKGDTPKIGHTDGQIRLANNGDEIILKKGSMTIDVLIYGNSSYSGDGWTGDPVSKPKEGEILRRNSLIDHDTREDWEKNKDDAIIMGLTDFKPEKFEFDGEVTAFVSPDSSFATLTNLMDDAEEKIYVYMYTVDNFSLIPSFKKASEDNIDIKLIVEKKPAGGMNNNELEFLYHINDLGGEIRLADKPYVFNHQKLIIIDDCVIISSENLGYSGLPVDNTYGNRGFWIAIHDEDVTDYYLNLFNSDWDNSEEFEGYKSQKSFINDLTGQVYTPSGNYRPSHESKTIYGHFVVYPVIGPDFSLKDNPVLDAINESKDQILVEIFYIDLLWNDNLILNEIINASKRGTEVYILLDSSDYNTEHDKIDNDDFVRFIEDLADEKGYPIHAQLMNMDGILRLHNKSMIIDDAVFVSSFNWNENSFSNNREVGILVENEDLSRYYEKVFWDDWGKRTTNYGSVILIISVAVILVSYLGYKIIQKNKKR